MNSYVMLSFKDQWHEFLSKKRSNDDNNFVFRTALNTVEGYLIDPSKPWCNPFAISEPSFTKKVRI